MFTHPFTRFLWRHRAAGAVLLLTCSTAVALAATGPMIPAAGEDAPAPAAVAAPQPEVPAAPVSSAGGLTALVKSSSPKAAFAALRAALAADPKLAPGCHDLAHVIGRAAYAKYGSFQAAMVYNDDLCGSGYIHSLAVETLKASQDPAAVISTLCQGQDGYCYHGIGHGLMFYTDGDVPRSLAYCAGLDTGEQAGRCAEGVFMQNFEADPDDAAPYLYADDPLRLCREHGFKTACYHYAGAYLAHAWKTEPDLFKLCDAAEDGFRAKCVSGMGAHLMITHLAKPKAAEAICLSAADRADVDACIDGLVSYHLVNYNSTSKTEAFCATMEASDQKTCRAALEARRASYQ